MTEKAKRGPVDGPSLRDAQQKVIPFDGTVKAPMVALGKTKPAMLEPNFREGPTMTKPIMSLMQMVDAGAEFWLSQADGLMMYLKGDHENPVNLSRVNNTLGLETYVFDRRADARAHAKWTEEICPVSYGGASSAGDAQPEAADPEDLRTRGGSTGRGRAGGRGARAGAGRRRGGRRPPPREPRG